MPKSSKYYVVFNGRIPGVYNTLEECDEQVNDFVSSYYKDFSSLNEANEAFEKRKKDDSENATSSYLFEFTNILQILENDNDEEKLTISTRNKNIYLMFIENRIPKWLKNDWMSRGAKLKAPKEICIRINEYIEKRKNIIEYNYSKKGKVLLSHSTSI
ncbi:4041_t:CDS:1 [Cetraspora pellucida]|uniref:4041_t:CDS:1 n=1 Tax=Cetraspora pellucida TaxID=1433469 RepID=A0ACA9PG43_9GLOM|nr:4041_t:CDS:1 [Cetraspora pellucida]